MGILKGLAKAAIGSKSKNKCKYCGKTISDYKDYCGAKCEEKHKEKKK